MKNKLFNIIVVVLAVMFIGATFAEAGSHGSRDRNGRNGYSNHDRHRHRDRNRHHGRHHRNHNRNFGEIVATVGTIIVLNRVVDAMFDSRTSVDNNYGANEPPPMAQVWVEGHWENGRWIPSHYEWVQVGPGSR